MVTLSLGPVSSIFWNPHVSFKGYGSRKTPELLALSSMANIYMEALRKKKIIA
jgi:hypothetical protein